MTKEWISKFPVVNIYSCKRLFPFQFPQGCSALIQNMQQKVGHVRKSLCTFNQPVQVYTIGCWCWSLLCSGCAHFWLDICIDGGMQMIMPNFCHRSSFILLTLILTLWTDWPVYSVPPSCLCTLCPECSHIKSVGRYSAQGNILPSDIYIATYHKIHYKLQHKYYLKFFYECRKLTFAADWVQRSRSTQSATQPNPHRCLWRCPMAHCIGVDPASLQQVPMQLSG